MGKLEEMRDRLNRIKDPELLEVARELLSEMAEIQRLKEQIEMREESLVDGKRAAFYFFAMGLSPDELGHATNTAIGRIRFLREKAEREDLGKPKEEAKEKEETEEKTPPVITNNFGGLGSSFGGDSDK